ncbi:MAG: thioesterase family protein [Rhodospirillales bacterium]|nr:thioesterase family protein [Rhodospirillales bacterium]
MSVRLLADGAEVVRASALRIRIDPKEMPAIASGPPVTLAMPELCGPPEFLATETPFLKGIEMRTAKGGFRIPGPAAVWYRAARPIVEGAEISPLMRAVIAADFCNGTSSVFDMNDWTFINADLTVSLGREPAGEWVLLDAETWIGPDSIGIAAARLADRQGYFGRAVQSIIFEKR